MCHDDSSSQFAPSMASYAGIPAGLLRIEEAESATRGFVGQSEGPYRMRWEKRGKDPGRRCWKGWRDPQQESLGLYQAALRHLEVPGVSYPVLKILWVVGLRPSALY